MADVTGSEDALRSLDSWLCQDVLLDERDPERVAGLLEEALGEAEFHSVERSRSGNAIEVSGRYGSKVRALLVGFLPAGKHIPWGKRLGARATIRGEGARTKVTLRVTPWMELFDESEALLISQTPTEKGSDEYFATVLLHEIADALRTATNTPLPDDASVLNPKTFATDFITGLLLYALEGDATKKVVHVPADTRTPWSWKAFFVPELWFVSHEIWGVSLLVVAIDWGLFKLLEAFPNEMAFVFAAAVVAGCRLAAGATAHNIFYARHGRWPDAAKN